MSVRRWMMMWVSVCLCTSVSFAVAQEGGGMKTATGKGSVTEAIDGDVGAVFDIGGGITMVFPKGIPVGHSRLVTLKKAKQKPKPNQIHENFKPVGTALDFDGALNTSGKPIVLSQTMSKDPTKPGQKLVIAVEIATFCNDSNKAFKLKNGLCSGWELQDADYESGRLVAPHIFPVDIKG